MANRGLRVLMLGYYPVGGKVFGGTQAVVGALAPALANDSEVERVLVLSFIRGEGPERTERLSDKLEVRYVEGQRKLNVLTRSFRDVMYARRVVAEFQPDIIHGHGMGWSGDVATQLSPAAIVTVHGMIHVEARMASKNTVRDRIRVALIEQMARRVLKRASVVISISPYASKTMDGMVAGDLVHIANPIAAEFFTNTPVDTSRKQLLFAGVMRPRKNVEGIVNAFAVARQKHPDATLTIVGPVQDAAYERRVRERVAALGMSEAVNFVGFVENDRLIAELQRSQALVMFSQEETLPTIIAQAHAAGRAVISSRVGGIAEMVTDGESGFLVEANDEAALAERMVALFDSPERCRAMGAAGNAIATSRYAQPAIARQTISAYQQALRKQAVRAGKAVTT